MFPSKDDAIKIALSDLTQDIIVHRVTDQESELGNVYCPPPGCWYVVYTIQRNELFLESSSYIAISKVDGSVIGRGSLNDEG